MEYGSVTLPSGYRLAFHETVDSTNAEALRLAAQGEAGGLWIWAASQQLGKGRAGRGWTSPSGNLYASLLIRPGVPLKTASQLSLLAGIAAHDAISSLASSTGQSLDLRLKWPNDILVGTAKLGGILLESAAEADKDAPAIVIGIGVNLASSPDGLGRAVAALTDAGVPVTPRQAFAALVWATAEWLGRWQNGSAFDLIRTAWLERAQSIGGPISVRLGDDLLRGTFLGIDDAGALRLSLASGEERRITAGDVAIGAGG